MRSTPAARTDGLSSGAGYVEGPVAKIALALGLASLLALGIGGAIVAACLLAIAYFVFREMCLRTVGGQTGDTLGALQQIAEILVLIVASVVF